MGIVLEAKQREETGKNAARRLRTAELIPAVVYGKELGSIAVTVSQREVLHILQSDSGRNTIFELSVGTDKHQVLIRDLQIHPVRGTLMHADFFTVAMDRKMEFEIPIEFVGKAKGVTMGGGILEVITREVTIECFPGDVPENIPVDVSDLDIGDPLHVSDLDVDDSNFTLVTEPERVVVMVSAPALEEVEEEVIEEEEVEGEPEVIKKGKEDEEDSTEE